MSPMPKENSKVSFLKKIQTKVRYGLTMFNINNLILKKIGITFTPYILFQEGINFSEITEFKRLPSEYSFELLGPEDMKIIGTLDIGFSEEELLTRLCAGENCIGLKHNNEIAAFMWINFKEYSGYSSTPTHLKNNEAYLRFMYTVKSYRGKNLAPYLRYKSYETLNESGRDVLYSISDYFNSPAVKFKKKLNAKKLKIMLYIKLSHKLSWNFTLKSF
jgi:hypothetical protein